MLTMYTRHNTVDTVYMTPCLYGPNIIVQPLPTRGPLLDRHIDMLRLAWLSVKYPNKRPCIDPYTDVETSRAVYGSM